MNKMKCWNKTAKQSNEFSLVSNVKIVFDIAVRCDVV